MYAKLLTFKETRYFKSSPLLQSRLGELQVVTVNIGGCNELPEVSVTAEVYKGREPIESRMEMAGCNHEIVTKYFKPLAPLVKWHLWTIDGAMHYAGNALYWLGWYGWWREKPGCYPTCNMQMFKEHANWGVLPEDQEPPADWLANSHELLLNHSDGMMDDLHSYLWRHPEFAAYMRPYIHEAKDEITERLIARAPGLREAMFADLEAAFQAADFPAGLATDLMHKRLR